MDEDLNISFGAQENVVSKPTTSQNALIYDWSITDLRTLCKRIKEQTLRISKVTAFPYAKTEARLNWQMVAFDDYDPDECRTKWHQVCTNIRTFRSLNEIVDDAERWLENPKKAKEAKVQGKSHPDKPSKPATVFFRYMMEQMPKMKLKYPDVHHRELVSKIGESYKSLSQKKVDQFKRDYAHDMEDYKVRLEEFYHAHPEIAPSKSLATSSPRGHSGLAYFIAEKQKDPKYANCSKDDLRSKWLKLNDDKKVQYIEMALDAHRKNKGGVSLMAKPDKDVLSKDERIVYDRFLGKPEKAPASGFYLFKSIACAAELQELTQTDRNKELQLRWSGMSRADQNKFNNEVKIMKQQYDRKMSEYLERLQKREQLLADQLLTTSSNTFPSNGEASPAKRVRNEALEDVKPNAKRLKQAKLTALSWYQKSHLDEWKQLNPELPEKDILLAIKEQFSQLSEKKQTKWTRKAKEENERRGLV